MIDWLMAQSGAPNWALALITLAFGGVYYMASLVAKDSMERLRIARMYLEMASDSFGIGGEDESEQL